MGGIYIYRGRDNCDETETRIRNGAGSVGREKHPFSQKGKKKKKKKKLFEKESWPKGGRAGTGNNYYQLSPQL
jgi:hypothetical protein